MGHRSTLQYGVRNRILNYTGFQKNVSHRYYRDGFIPMETLENLYGQRLSLWARVQVLEIEIADLKKLVEAQAKFINEMENK